MTVILYHNPRCSKSRAALELLRKRSIEPRIIEYLNEPPSADELKAILNLLGMKPRELLRAKEAREAGLDDPSLSDDALIQEIIDYPIVIERPIVVSGDRARAGRPPERVLEVL